MFQVLRKARACPASKLAFPPRRWKARQIRLKIMPSTKEINDYYAFSKLDYRLYNSSVGDLSMHYGMWDKRTHTHREALANENRVLADVANIGQHDHVIDLGCGYGSTAVWLAAHVGCRVTGVTLSEDQIADARKLARKRRVEDLVTFGTMDFHRTRFADSTFDVAVSIESISHSSQKPRVLAEAWRILKPGGRIAVADGYFGKDPKSLTPPEKEIAATCFEGVHVPPLPQKSEFANWLEDVGFEQVCWFDKTHSILPTAERVNRLGRMLLPVAKVFSLLGLRSLQVSHMKAFVSQYYAFRDGLGVYGVFCARKPTRILVGTSKITERSSRRSALVV
jgi:tocopherol O-methyltransferase